MSDFYWCRSGCNTWHDRRTDTGIHFAMPVYGEEPPTERNFPGTPEELRRFQVERRLRIEDRARAEAEFQARVDAELGYELGHDAVGGDQVTVK